MPKQELTTGINKPPTITGKAVLHSLLKIQILGFLIASSLCLDVNFTKRLRPGN
jgi:hypothetical protein